MALYVAANQLAYIAIIIINNRFVAGPQIYTTAFIVFQLPYAIFAVSIFTALLPGMSERWSSDSPEGVRTLVSRGLRDMAVVTLPATAGLLVLAEPITRLLFQHGQAGPEEIVAISRALQGFAVGLVFFSSFQLLTRSFYATQNSRTPALVNVGAAVVNVGAALLYVGLGLGLRGTALAHATSYAVAATVLFWRLRHRVGPLDGRRIARTVAKLTVASVASAGVAWVVAELWALPADATVLLEAAQVTTAILAGVLVFLGGALILRVGEVDDLRRAILGRLRR